MRERRSATRTRDLGVLALVVLGPIWGYGWVATKVAVLTYTMPFWLLLLAWFFLGERLRGTLSIPVVGVLAAWLQLGERPNGVEAAGMVLIVSALAILAVRGLVLGRREPAPESAEPDVRPVTD